MTYGAFFDVIPALDAFEVFSFYEGADLRLVWLEIPIDLVAIVTVKP